MPGDDYTISTRHLAPSELIMDLLNKHGGAALIHAAILRSDVPVTPHLLKQALAILAEHQPVLKMRIATEVGKKNRVIKRFMLMEKPVLDIQVQHGKDRTTWISLAEAGLQTPFDSASGPLWKLMYVMFDDSQEPSDRTSRGSAAEVKMWKRASRHSQHRHSHKTYKFTGALLFKIHHAIADAFSMLDLLNYQLMPILTKLQNEEDLADLQTPLFMSPSADDVFVGEEKVGWGERRKIKKEQEKFKKSNKSGEEKASEKLPEVSPYLSPLFEVADSGASSAQWYSLASAQTHLIPFVLSDRLSHKIISESNKNDVSVQEAILTAAVIALGLVDRGSHSTFPDVVCSYPVNLRHLNPQTAADPTLGLWTGSIIHKIKPSGTIPSPSHFWQEVTKVSAGLDKDCRPWDLLALYKEVAKSPAEDTIIKLYHAHARAQLEVSVVQTRDTVVPERKDSLELASHEVNFTIDEYYYMKSMSDVSNVPLALTVTLLNGKVMWTLAHNSTWISRAFAVKFIDTLHILLKNVVSGWKSQIYAITIIYKDKRHGSFIPFPMVTLLHTGGS